MVTRVVSSCTIYLLVIVAFGGVHSPLAVFAIPACLLIGLAFSAPIAAYSATCQDDGVFPVVTRFAIVPMFLFSGTFFPISQLPTPLEWVAYATPLWHGVDLCRSLTLGTAQWPLSILHVVYLAAWGAVGLVVALRTYRERLLK
jgi:lipooligosaccharide transport system permease protein